MFKRLTPRQTEVAKAMLRGNTNQEIANSLGITRNTVKVHSDNLFKRLSIHNRWEVFKLAIDAGMLKFTPKYEKAK